MVPRLLNTVDIGMQLPAYLVVRRPLTITSPRSGNSNRQRDQVLPEPCRDQAYAPPTRCSDKPSKFRQPSRLKGTR